MKATEPKSSTPSNSLQTKSGEQQSPFFDKEGANGVLSNTQQHFLSLAGGSNKPFFTKPGIQTKLTIGQPGDKYEQEADAMADQVVQRLAENDSAGEQPALKISNALQRKPIFESEAEPKIQAKPLNGHTLKTTVVQPKCAKCEQEEQIQEKENPGEEEKFQMKLIFESAAPPPDAGTVQRAYADSATEEEAVQTHTDGGPATASSPTLESRLQSSQGGGSPMPKETRSNMESAMGADFKNVRIHNDSSAVQMNQDLHAQAFTHGSDIYFNSGKYDHGSTEGQRLLAHELTHTIQQDSTKEAKIQRSATDDPRLEDPNFLICLISCYVGLPPGLWRTLVQHMLRAISEQYRGQYGEERGSERFREFSAVYSTWSLFNKIKAVVTFIGESRVGPITLNLAKAEVIRGIALRTLARAGIREGSMIAASQIIRKASIYLELAWATGCFAYCTAEQYAIMIRDLSLTIVQGIVEGIEAISTIAGGITNAFGSALNQALMIAQAKMDFGNWEYAPELNPRSRAHLNIISLTSRLATTPDTYLSYLGRRLNTYQIDSILGELSEDLNSAMQSRGGLSQIVVFTPAFLGGLTPLTLIDLLVDYRFINFRQSPELLADERVRQLEVSE